MVERFEQNPSKFASLMRRYNIAAGAAGERHKLSTHGEFVSYQISICTVFELFINHCRVHLN